MPNTIFPMAGGVPPRTAGRGELLTLINTFDWSSTGVGPIAGWPEAYKTTTRLMLSSNVPMVMLMGPDGVMIYNDAYSGFAGQRHPALLGSKVLEGWPEVADLNRRVMDTCMSGETLNLENQELVLWRNQLPEKLWADLDYSPVLGEDGKPIGVLAIVSETTKRVIAERALARSEERLSLALNASGIVGIWDWDLRSGLVTADRRFAEMYGVDPERAAAGAPISDFVGGVHPEDRQFVTDSIAAALRERVPYRAEYRLQDGAGAIRWVIATGTVMLSPEGRAVRLAGVSVDITERKLFEAALAESEAKFRAIADTMPQMVWSTLPDGYHDYYNARWYEFTGMPVGSTDGEAWNGMFHPEDQETAWAAWRHSLATGEDYQVEYRLRHHSGVYRWTLGRAVPIRDERGQILRWFGTCTDIHETKIAAEERELVAQELSHRIKNIFSVLNGIVALSARTYPELKPLAEQLRARISALGQAHDFVRPHSRASRPTDVETSIRGLLDTLLAPYRKSGETHIAIGGADTLIDDRSATPLALLFHELATNSAKYGALSVPDGQIDIRFETTPDDFIIIWDERGAPARSGIPTREGFGTRLIALSIEGQLEGRIDRQWRDDGVRVEIAVPHRSLTRDDAKA